MNLFKNEKTLPVLVVVAGSLLVGVIVLYGYNTGKITLLNNKNQKQNLNQEIKEEVKRTDYTDVARKTLDWIDKQRNDEGWYILERGCDYEKKTCDVVWDNKEGNKDGLIATWARLNFYEQHKDPKDLEIVKKDIDIFYEKYKNDNLKDSLWICKITYEMAQSKYIDRTQKDKLKDLCMNIEYISPQEMKNYLENQSGELNKFKGEPWVNWRGYSLVIRGFDSHFTLATEMIARLQWQIENKNLDLAKEYWQITKGYLDVAGIENKCLLGLTSLDIYKNESKQKEFLDFTESIYNKYMIEGGNNVKREYQTTMCGLMLKGLYGITGKSKYGKGLEDNNTFLTKFNNDDGNNKNLEIAAQGGFYKSNNGGVFMPYKNVVENGLLINLLIN